MSHLVPGTDIVGKNSNPLEIRDYIKITRVEAERIPSTEKVTLFCIFAFKDIIN